METEQAHSTPQSVGRDAALRRPRTPQSYASVRPRTAPRAVPAIWLNLVCLDAPIVAAVWLWLFARTFQVPVHLGNATALFLTAWLIYLADRLADVSSLQDGSPRSLRQEFCLRHRQVWTAALLMIGGVDCYLIWRNTAAETFFIGAIVGVLALIYLVLNHPLGLIWRSLPAKEFAIGSLFTAGTLVALLPAFPTVTPPFVAGAFAFVALCTLNCISIARWERKLDQAQRKVSIATRHPGFSQRVGKICAGLAVATFAAALVYRQARPIFGCVSVSALLLAWLNASPDIKEGRFPNRPRRFANHRSVKIEDDQRTALADLILLTPIIPLIVMAL